MSHPLFGRQILEVVIGSRAYGMDHAGSDTDRRGVFLPTSRAHWALGKSPVVIRDDAREAMAWELERCLTLALTANPTVLEVLFSPLVLSATPLGERLRDLAPAFLTTRLHATCGGVAGEQFAKLERRRDAGKPVKWKHAAHCLRLLATGTRALRGEGFPVRVAPEHRDTLLAVRRGEKTLEEVDALRRAWAAGMDAALAASPLPAEPDVARVDAFLIDARRRAASSDELP